MCTPRACRLVPAASPSVQLLSDSGGGRWEEPGCSKQLQDALSFHFSPPQCVSLTHANFLKM